jgi:hypothetical protein
MFALRDDNEPIVTAVADRIAYAIANDAESRQSVVKNFKRVYAIRSKKAHHGRTIDEVTLIEACLLNIWKFFIAAIQSAGRFRTKIAFLDHLDHVKYS